MLKKSIKKLNKKTQIVGLLAFGLILGGSTAYLTQTSQPENSLPQEQIGISQSVANHDFDSITSSSDLIISGTVESTTEFQTLNNNLYQTQLVDVVVTDNFKGDAKASETITVEVNSYHENPEVKVHSCVSDDPQFTEGESVLLFLKKRTDNDTYIVTGINQGLMFPNTNAKSQETTYIYHSQIDNDIEPFTTNDLYLKLN